MVLMALLNPPVSACNGAVQTWQQCFLFYAYTQLTYDKHLEQSIEFGQSI